MIKEGTRHMSRNLTFFILGLTAAILTYFFSSSLSTIVEMVISEKLPKDFIRLLQNSDLVAFAGSASMFGLLFTLLYLFFPVAYVWYQINAARDVVSELPLASNPVKRTDKKTFLSRLKGIGFIGKLSDLYGKYLIQGAEQEVKEEVLKNTRLLKKKVKETEKKKMIIAPVRATAPAEVIFNSANLINENLLLGFFRIFARILMGIAIISLGISVISFSLTSGEVEMSLFDAIQPGMVALIYGLVAAVIIAGLINIVSLILSQNVRSLAMKINGLFHQNEWQQDMDRVADSLTHDPLSAQLEKILQNALEKPMLEISAAVKGLAENQEQKLDQILSGTLASFSDTMEHKLTADIATLNKSLKEAASVSAQMRKHYADKNAEFSKLMDKQATAIAKHLVDMQKVLKNSERTTQRGTTNLVKSLSSGLEETYGNLGVFVQESLKKIEDKQAALDAAVNNKDSILQDLHNTAKDLGTISNASGRLLEKFSRLSADLDKVLTNIQESGVTQNNGGADRRDKLKAALTNLKKATQDKVANLPDM